MNNTTRFRAGLLLSLILAGAAPMTAASAQTPLDNLKQFALDNTVTLPLSAWKFHQPDVPGGEMPDFDDSAWQTVAPGFNWTGEDSTTWFRVRYVVPTTVNGIAVEGSELNFEAGMDDFAEIYVNGKRVVKFHWDDGHVILSKHAHAGDTYVIALRGINTIGPQGGLHFGRIVYDLLGALQPDFASYLQEAQFVAQTAPQAQTADKQTMTDALKRSEDQIDITAIRARDWNKAVAGVADARKTLLGLTPITHKYDVYYVGHAHIDMNWLWTWPETIDVCHRTWDSAMNLMDEFPDFGFVQSQPGAYTAIQQQYPDEFKRMQAASQRGQWDTVGGLYDESDTNMPSGEGLARSLFLGQRYFKANFGHYATTGWLPDSFGHSWQLPQLLEGAGISNFYHTRCGDGSPFAWWQSPDGSQVLKANTGSYDEPITSEQMTRPWQTEQNDGLKQTLVVFGVGDHGGGPTRDMIEVGRGLQADPLYPKVHFVTADAFFDQLRKEHGAADLPVVDTDLQYVFVGCYTTHADLKKAVRDSENNLYAAEVFSSLAAMNTMNAAQPYPIQAFEDAWKPTAFAQFHDIMCGSAIHSTYDWMHEQLAPAFAFEKTQTDTALKALADASDTSGARAGEQPVTVWNALSFPRTDIARVTVPDSSAYRSARDAAGHLVLVQALDPQTVAFVAADVPAIGHSVYYLSPESPEGLSGSLVHETADGFVLENTMVRVTLAKDTGLITGLFDKPSGKEMIAPGQSANLLQVLGDNGSAWDIGYTGEQHLLNTGAEVKIVAQGPVCSVVQVTHKYGTSTFTQNITIYQDMRRVDVPTTVDWHEHGQLLKVAFPLALANPTARVGIPYGSIERPTSGQENPGQKWMDVTEEQVGQTTGATTLDLTSLFNHQSTGDFDGLGIGYTAALMPPAGIQSLGSSRIPFRLPAPGGMDNIACEGQIVPLTAAVPGANSIYLLAASAPASKPGTMTLVQANGRKTRLFFQVGDWVAGGGLRNTEGLGFDHRTGPNGVVDASKPHLWIVPVSLPEGIDLSGAQLILPRNPAIHIFALSLGTAPKRTPVAGLTVLNDCKYGSDTTGSVFRLTLLRSSHNPDPNPDEGLQSFTYSLLGHTGDPRVAGAEAAGLGLNIPLRAVLTPAHPGQPAGTAVSVTTPAGGNRIIVGALKHAEDGPGYILRLFETQGQDTVCQLKFSHNVRVEETDLLERPIHGKRRMDVHGDTVILLVGHDQIVTLHITGLPDAGDRNGRVARR